MAEPKDNWDKFDITSKFIVSVPIAVIAGLYTYSQNRLEKQRQAKLGEVETLSKFMSYLSGTNQSAKEAALTAMRDVSSSEFMTTIAKLFPSEASLGAVQTVLDSPASTETQRQLASAALATIKIPPLRGKTYSFGSKGSGADDEQVPPGESLALVKPEDLKNPEVANYFLPKQPQGTTGLMARLNPKTFYLACRYDPAMSAYLRSHLVTVRNALHPERVEKARVVERGPPRRPEYDGYVAALSPALATKLGLKKGDDIEISFEPDESP